MRQIQFLDELQDGTYICIISSDNQQSLIIEKFINGKFVKDSSSGTYKTARMMSEALRDAIGYGPARDLLIKNGVSLDDPLLYLGVHN